METKDLRKLIDGARASTEFIKDEIKYICCNIGERTPGSIIERNTAMYLACVLKVDCGCKEIKIESFTEHPGSYKGTILLAACLGTISSVILLIYPVLSLICSAAALMILLLHFILHIDIFDKFFRPAIGTNVTAIRKCSGTVKRRIFFNGHMDVAESGPSLKNTERILLLIHVTGTTLGIVYLMIMAIISLSIDAEWINTASYAGLAVLLFMPGLIIISYKKRNEEGIGELNGCFMGIGLLKTMETQGIALEDTEIGIILTSSKEIGLKGAKAWCRDHQNDYDDVPTYIYTFDRISDLEQLDIKLNELNGIVDSDREMANVFKESALEHGIKCNNENKVFRGTSTDSGAFSLHGFRSVGITSKGQKAADKNSNEPEGLESLLRAVIHTVARVNSGVLELDR